MTPPDALARAALPASILDVLRRLGEAGHRSWLVGGAVRDLLLGRVREGTDFDVATPATPQAVTALFPRVIPTGIDHGTVTVIVRGEHVEVTTFRGEGAYEDGRRPSSVTFHGDLEADLARRDLTINAIAWDPLAGELRDPFGGQADLAARRVRAVGDPAARFGEDGLRALRAVRFAAQLGFALDPPTEAAIPGVLPVVRKVSIERIADELVKTACAPDPARGLALLASTGLLGAVLPELAAVPPEARGHAGLVAGAVAPEPAPRLAALLHVLPAARVGPLLVALRLSRKLADEAGALAAAHRCRLAGAAPPAGGEPVRRWLSAAGRARGPALVALARAEAEAAPPEARAGALAEAGALAAAVAALGPGVPLEPRDLAVDGGALMRLLAIPPGPLVGLALRHLLDRVLADPGLNSASALEAEARAWWAARAGRL
ncbi:MAG: tRNA cytidylyltransferase [Anaeromyxobacter sp.]